MIRGGDFYAIWDEERGIWSTDEQDAIDLIDNELDLYSQKYEGVEDIRVLHMWDSENGLASKWHKYVREHMRDRYVSLDEELVWLNTEVGRENHSSKKLPYALERTPIDNWDMLISTLYDPEERKKIEWCIGSIVSGDSKELQKFAVLYGSAGTGKSTVLNIIQQLFAGYYTVFDARALGNASNQFALEPFKSSPLVAIQHDGDLSHIEDNTRLNSLVSHELMTVNEKYKSSYSNRFKAFLFMGTNRPVKITDAKSGLLRRLIDIQPSGRKLTKAAYDKCMAGIQFELGGIALHCKDVYEMDKKCYDGYIPMQMLDASNDMYNFVVENYFKFEEDDQVTLKAAYELYKMYCDDARVPYPMSKRAFKEELKNYFHEYKDRDVVDGVRVRNIFLGFKTSVLEADEVIDIQEQLEKQMDWLKLTEQPSILDTALANCPAQLCKNDGTPKTYWRNVTTALKDLNTRELHYVKVPENHIVIDFDIPDENGNKNLQLNINAARQFPKTYAEVSKSGNALHLHYLYSGDVKELQNVYADHIEIKVYTGNSALRRKLTLCNNSEIAHISAGLPKKQKEVGKTIDIQKLRSEEKLRELIDRNLRKEIHPGTKPSMDFIKKILDDAYESDLVYDVTDLRPKLISFASKSTNQSDYCLRLIRQLKFRSKTELPIAPDDVGDDIVIFDIEVFPNVLFVNWSPLNSDTIIRWINPKPVQIEQLCSYKIVGYNNRRYDNHILYGRMIDNLDNIGCYELSKKIVSGDSNCFYPNAYNLSYTDVYDFASSKNKMSLKKLEIKMGFHHQELGLDWDKPVHKNLWEKVSSYCDNDVLATKMAFRYLSADWEARQILASLANASVNDTTNSLTTKIIFDGERFPQKEFLYRNLSSPVTELEPEVESFLKTKFPKMVPFDNKSLLPYFPGYIFDMGRSLYKGVIVGEGGYAKGEPGIWYNVALLDVASMHPHSIISECLFGPRFTKRFDEIVVGRVDIKHEEWDELNDILNGKLTPFLEKVKSGKMTSAQLADALKTAINSVYGLTSASFDNAFRDPRNKDNIVAKRGALFMLNLKEEVEKRGFVAAHIKTDSIKIPNATPEIIKFVMEFGERYGYSFEHEATYEKMCLVNDAVYVAQYATPDWCQEAYGYIPGDNKKHGGTWTATGAQFQVPYVFKTLFSHEEIVFEDLCEIKSVTSALYLDMNEKLLDVEAEEKELKKLETAYRKGTISDTTYEKESTRLHDIITKGHDYQFIGRVGLFCPIVEGKGGGLLMRIKDGKYYSVGGTKGYRWLEAEMIKGTTKEQDIDISYHEALVSDAIAEIHKYGDETQFLPTI